VGLGGDKWMTPKWFNYMDLGCYALFVSSGIFQEDERHSVVEEYMTQL